MAGEQGQSSETRGTDLSSAANQIAGLLDDDGHFNPNPDQLSRAHPDYDESTDERADGPQGRDERGRFQKKAADAEQDLSPTGDELAEDVSDEDIVDQKADDDTDEEQINSADDGSETTEEDTGEPIETLQQFADALELPLDELLGNVQHTFSAAGEEVTVKLSELVGGYQKDADYRRNTGKLAEDRRTAELDYANRMTQFDQANQESAAQMSYLQEYFMQQLNGPQLEQLRNVDPGEWTAKRTELTERLQELQGVRQQAANNYQVFKARQLEDLKGREMGKLAEKKADFSDADRTLAKQTMQSVGFGEDEIGQIFDHRVVMAVLELANLRQEVETLRTEKSTARETTKRIKKDVPKLTQKPGKARRQAKGLNRDAMQNLRNRARKTGRVEDAAKIIENLI